MKHSINTNKILQKTTWVTGCARSGTTILGKILSTLKGVEYAFEPETLFSLIPLIHNVEKKYWTNIYETYLIEDLFFNSCLGRKINLKKNDDSSIYNSLNKRQIKQKLYLSLRRKEFDSFLKKNKKMLIIKIPDLARSLVKLQNYYPQNKFIVTKRSKSAIISSIIKKGWFKKKNIHSTEIYNNKYWLEPKLYKSWVNANENIKANIYVDMIEKNLRKIKKKYVVDFKTLIKNPKKIIKEVCNYLNLKATHKTEEIIDQIDTKKKI